VRELAANPRSGALERAFIALKPETIAKVLFTSGSTGRPKGVVNTQRMLTSNQESLAACWPFLATQPPVVVDWLPWSHTFGGNHNFFLVLRNGGTLFIDRGRPAPGLIETTVHNLADVSPTLWFNVPRGFDQAVAMLEEDPVKAAAVFAKLALVFYAAAALSPSTRARLEKVAAAAGRSDVFFTSAWGSTETSPLSTSDEARPEEGVVFVGRLSENFKLSSGTWVNVAHVRLGLVDACAPLVLDAVIAGHDRPEVGALLFLSPAAKRLAPDDVRERIWTALTHYNNAHHANSERVVRIVLLEQPPSLDEGETTDKGYTNQRRVLEHRAAEVERLFTDPHAVV
jgi:acyl-CoA synthetase (AMP-forming)/AMP-acid ligase II